jgi:hypothetical protein
MIINSVEDKIVPSRSKLGKRTQISVECRRSSMSRTNKIIPSCLRFGKTKKNIESQ